MYNSTDIRHLFTAVTFKECLYFVYTLTVGVVVSPPLCCIFGLTTDIITIFYSEIPLILQDNLK